jgi:outer membrane receptor protein involved in Fe transport
MFKGRNGRLGNSLAILLLLSLSIAYAQTSPGTIKGVVVDKDGSPLPGATVTLENRAIGVVGLGGVTNAQGEFRIMPVPAGKAYALRVSLPGYQKIEFTIEVYAGKTVVQNVTLREEFKERVKVIGKEEVVNTESAQTSTSISSEFISGLPILGTDYQDVLTLAPGVTDVNNTGNPNIHGARDTDVVTLVDGVSTTDPFDGHYGQNLNTESIEEIEVITSGAGAQYGRAQGGFVNVLTKSGGNEFKGTFTFRMRTHLLDGDGAGIDKADVRGGLGESDGFRDMSFTTIYPYLSLSGAFVRDHLWYYLAPEYTLEETPINAGTQGYIQTLEEARVTGKVTWQVSANNKMTFLALIDDQSIDNNSLNSRTALESGVTLKRGGPTLTLSDSAIFNPQFSLDSTVSRFDQATEAVPTTNPDTNGNGILVVDQDPNLGGNKNGFVELREVDAGEDFDKDGDFDVFEDFGNNHKLDLCRVDPLTLKRTCDDDLDHDGRLTGPFGCEGHNREDINCNGQLDFEVDANGDGKITGDEDKGILCDYPGICKDHYLLDADGNSTKGNGKLDSEDRNGNLHMDDVPFPNWVDKNHNGVPETGEFTAPTLGDKQYIIQLNTNLTSGPYFFDRTDSRTRDTLREDVSYYVDDLFGSHDLKMGMVFENEGYHADFGQRPIWNIQTGGTNLDTGQIGGQIGVFLPTKQSASNSADGRNLGMFLSDTYKPLPNLTIGLGLRFDREEVSSSGYTTFDPQSEAIEYAELLNIASGSGVDTNNDGIKENGFSKDPLFVQKLNAGDERHFQTLETKLKFAAGGRLTRHNFVTQIRSDFINQDQADILAQGHPRSPEDFTISNNNLSPRLSVSWDPWADGKTRASAAWSRLYDKIFLAVLVPEAGPDALLQYYRYDSDGVDGQGFPDNKVGAIISTAPPNAAQIDRNLKTPYTDELSLGFQREIAPEMSVSFNYIRRTYGDQLQDKDINHTYRKPGENGATCTSTTESGFCDMFGTTRRAPPNGSGGEAGGGQPDTRLPDHYPDLYIFNENFNQVLRTGNYNIQDYVGYELQFTRRLSRKWQMNASYVFSKTTGQAEAYNSESGDDPALTELRNGYLSYDVRHVAKFYATAFLPADWQVGGDITWYSGLPYSFVNRILTEDNVGYGQIRRIYGYRDVNSGIFYDEDRNIHRNHPYYNLNVRTEKSFVIGKVSAGAFFEIFNLLNTDDLRVFEIDDRVDSLQSAETRQFGRRFQFGIRMNF